MGHPKKIILSGHRCSCPGKDGLKLKKCGKNAHMLVFRELWRPEFLFPDNKRYHFGK